MNRIEDLEDIIKILVSILERNNVSKEIIKSELRKYHYCYDCMNHYRGCRCGDESESNISSSVDDDYTSSSYNSDIE